MKIGIIGKMCTGKTTLANLITRLDPRHQRYSFGTGVKEVATRYFDMKYKHRSLLVQVATQLKQIDPDVWIHYLFRQIKDSNYCVIDDVRHQNELDYLIEQGWFLIRLTLNEKERIRRLQHIYPNTYQDHIQNMEDISEQCDNLVFPKSYPVLTIHTDQPQQSINLTILSLLEKNKHK